MKQLLAVVVALAFVVVMVAPVFAQGPVERSLLESQAIAKGKSGNFKAAEVINCDAAKNKCTFKGAKGKTVEANMTYAGFNGGFNAAKELKPGTKVSGQWSIVDGKNFVTMIVAD